MLSKKARRDYAMTLRQMADLLLSDPTARPCLYLGHQWLVILTGPEDLAQRPAGFDGDLVLELPAHPLEEEDD